MFSPNLEPLWLAKKEAEILFVSQWQAEAPLRALLHWLLNISIIFVFWKIFNKEVQNLN